MNRDASFPPSSVPPGVRVYAIGDVHGRFDLLERLLDRVARDAEPFGGRRVLVVLGDMVDRGPASAQVLERLSRLGDDPDFARFERHMLMGNHEDMMLRFLAGEGQGFVWLLNGGKETVESYGVPGGLSPAGARAELLRRIPDAHRKFLDGLKTMHREGDYAFVHAGVRPHRPLDRQHADDLLWIRARFLDSAEDFGALVVHGHSPVERAEIHANRIAIDTRAWLSGTLTCLVLEGAGRRFLTT
ncbi:MAG: serine/threonine protein phosphatase [Alphaproteobacteria bacterium]|nr:serine/threonine protein phosphatase [Alphaproteobacteria bacterium]